MYMNKILLALACVSLCAMGCNRAAPPAAKGEAAAVVSVTPVQPEWKSLVRVVEQPGLVQPFEQTELFARVPGYVRALKADIGQKVRGPKLDGAGKETEPGEVLALIAAPEMEEEVAHKEALVRQAAAEEDQDRKALASAEAHIQVAEAMVVEAKAGLARAEALHTRWELESKRIGGLVERGVIDAQARDETHNQYLAAKAGREEAKARIVSAQAQVRKAETDRDKAAADLKAATAHIDVCQAEARRLKALLDYTRIRAPYDGVVTCRNVNTGDFVQPNGTKACLFSVARLDPVRVVFKVPEADAALVQENADVKLVFQALRGASVSGKVTRTSWALEPTSRTLRAEIDVPNPDDAGSGRRFRPGMYLNAQVTAPLPKGWVVPTSAIVKQGDTLVCFLINDAGDKVAATPVQVGYNDKQLSEVLRRQQPGTPPSWVHWTGKERIAEKAAGLTDGQAIRTEKTN